MRNTARLLAFALPIVGLAGLWGWSDYQSRQGDDWRVPIMGFDPRDLLRGHYIEFAYDWPGDDDASNAPLNQFCIEGTPPEITRIVVTENGDECAHYARVEYGSIYQYDGLRRGRLYVPQTRAKELEDKLRDRDLQGYIIVRQRADGKITPLELEFEPVTDEQRAAREANETQGIDAIEVIDIPEDENEQSN